MIVEHFVSHYRQQPIEELANMVAMAPMLAEAGAAPPDWRDRLESAQVVLRERAVVAEKDLPPKP